MNWWRKDDRGGDTFFPLSGSKFEQYMAFEHENDAPYSRMASALEALRFCEHVLGFDVDDPYDTVVTKGILTGSAKARRVGKQSRPLTSAEILSLEKLLADKEEDVRDRVFCGFFLFCIYSRCRVSDTHEISHVHIDVPSGGDCVQGFIELATHQRDRRMVEHCL